MSNLKFIDLFAGIGGFHLAFKSLGADCIFASEKDNAARQTYEGLCFLTPCEHSN